MSLPKQLFHWFEQRQTTLCHRQLLVITGQQEWTKNAADTLLGIDNIHSILWVGDSQVDYENIDIKNYRSKLGHEYDRVILNSFDGFRANAAMALSGTIKAQGLMVILCPEFSEWPDYDDPEKSNRLSYGYQQKNPKSFFIQHLISCFDKDNSVAILSANNFSGVAFWVADDETKERDSEQRYFSQQSAIKKICKVANGHRNRPLVITADRGRGKSSALGIAAAQLMQLQEKKSICITAPHLRNVEQVFFHSKRLLPDAEATSKSVTHHSSTLFFKPIDILLEDSSSVDLLLVDEASAIPVHILSKLAKQFSRIVFSSTIHGYEGSGRGFEMRFIKQLSLLKPNFKRFHLSQPMRWYQHDALEQFWFNAFFHNVQQGNKSVEITDQIVSCQYISKAQLLNDKKLLADLFGLLIDAHYQTSQDDLQRLLDAPEIKCLILSSGSTLLGVAQIIEEGGNNLTALADEIADCSRRVNGHLVAQNIASTSNNPSFLLARQWRISRIAIAPEHQQKGLGKQLIEFVEQQAKQQHIQFLTTSFGCNVNILKFWHNSEFLLSKLSAKPEVSSGEHSGICIKPLTDEAATIFKAIHTEFHQEFLYQMDKNFKDVSEDLLMQILLIAHSTNSALLTNKTNTANMLIVRQFAFGKRAYSTCKRILKEYLIVNVATFSLLETPQQRLLIAALIQNHTDKHLCKKFGLSGKKQIEQTLKTSYEKVLRGNLFTC